MDWGAGGGLPLHRAAGLRLGFALSVPVEGFPDSLVWRPGAAPVVKFGFRLHPSASRASGPCGRQLRRQRRGIMNNSEDASRGKAGVTGTSM